MMRLLKKIAGLLLLVKEIKNYNLIINDHLGRYKDEKGKNYVIELRRGIKCLLRANTNDRTRVREILINNEYLLSKSEIKDGDIVFDVGANIGMFCLNLVQQYNNLKIYAFEPESANFEMLTKQLELNNISNIQLEKKGIGSQATKLKLYKSPNTGGHSLINSSDFQDRNNLNNQTFEEVDIIKLETFLESEMIEKIDFLKMDIEGGEYDIFFNLSPSTLQKIQKIAMEYHYVSETENGDHLKSFLEKNGFEVQLNYPLLFAKRNN